MAIAELAPEPAGISELELVPAPAPPRLALPPGSTPIEPVRAAIRRYRAGRGTDASLVSAVDRHGDALEVEISRVAITRFEEFVRDVARLEALHQRIADLGAQDAWLRAFPSTIDRPVVPLTVELYGRRVPVPVVLDALRTVQLDSRLLRGAGRPRPRPRGAAASMAALADAGKTATDVALALGGEPSRAWKILNGHMPAPPELLQVLTGLVGEERAWLVIDGIPKHPRARAPASRAVKALHAAGVTTEDLAALVQAQPNTVRRWLSGTEHQSPKLARALEELLGADAAARVVALIPRRRRTRAPVSPALVALGEAGVTDAQLAELTGASRSTIRRWLAGTRPSSSEFAGALEQLVDADAAARVLALIPER